MTVLYPPLIVKHNPAWPAIATSRGGPPEPGATRQLACIRFLSIGLLCVVMGCRYLDGRDVRAHFHSRDVGWQARNPLLPKRIHLSLLWPDLSLTPQSPVIGPVGWRPVYSQANWRAFRKEFGTRQDNVIRRRLSQRIQLAADLLSAAGTEKSHGLRRLLLLRAFALSFRYHSGIPLARQALASYLGSITSGNLAQVAPVWTMANEMAFMHGSAEQNRRRAILAEAANVRLTMLLLNAGQVEDAARVVRHLVIHETRAVRADHPLLSAMGTARVLVSQTRVMMDFLAGEYKSMGSDAQSAMNVYLYTRFIRPVPNVRQWLENRWRNNAIGRLKSALLNCQTNIHAQFAAGRYLAAAAAPLPPGILRDRVFFAALVHDRAFMNSTKTRWDRIDRTLAKIAIQHLIEQGARPDPIIAPLKNMPQSASPRPN